MPHIYLRYSPFHWNEHVSSYISLVLSSGWLTEGMALIQETILNQGSETSGGLGPLNNAPTCEDGLGSTSIAEVEYVLLASALMERIKKTR